MKLRSNTHGCELIKFVVKLSNSGGILTRVKYITCALSRLLVDICCLMLSFCSCPCVNIYFYKHCKSRTTEQVRPLIYNQCSVAAQGIEVIPSQTSSMKSFITCFLLILLKCKYFPRDPYPFGFCRATDIIK